MTLLGGADIDVLVSAPGVDVTLTDATFVAGGLSVAIASIETATLVAPTLNAASTFSGVISLLASEASWTPVGPFSTTGGQVEGMEPQGNPVAGAINIVVVDPLHPNIAYAASPNGGIWKTTDFLATTTVINPQGGTMIVPAPTWTPLTDLSPSLSISTLTIDPADPNVLYAGTGVTSSSQEGGPVVGLFKTSDGGATWTPIGGTAFNKLRINRILVFHGSLSEKLLVGTSGGLYTTGLNGESPTKVSAGLPDGVISDLIRKAPDSTTVPVPPETNTVFAAIPGLGVYTSTNRGINWTLSKSLPLSQRIKLAVGSDGTLYVAELGTYSTITAIAATTATTLTLDNVADLTNTGEIRGVSTVAVGRRGGRDLRDRRQRQRLRQRRLRRRRHARHRDRRESRVPALAARRWLQATC